MAYTFAAAPKPDPDALGKYQVQLAKLKPQCCTCGKNVTAKIAATTFTASTRVCADREACRVRSILRKPTPGVGHRNGWIR